MPLSGRFGVAHAWIIDPEQQVLEVLRSDAGGTRHLLATHGENETVPVAPFEEIELELELLWGAPPA